MARTSNRSTSTSRRNRSAAIHLASSVTSRVTWSGGRACWQVSAPNAPV